VDISRRLLLLAGSSSSGIGTGEPALADESSGSVDIAMTGVELVG
jgi:hypothetical protein